MTTASTSNPVPHPLPTHPHQHLHHQPPPAHPHHYRSTSGSATSAPGTLHASSYPPKSAGLSIIPPEAYSQHYLSHLPPPYAPLGEGSHGPIDPSLLPPTSGPHQGYPQPPNNSNREQSNNAAYPSVMVYPPPPPIPTWSTKNDDHPSHGPTTSPLEAQRRGSFSLPSMTSWAPPPNPSPHGTNNSGQSSPNSRNNASNNSVPYQAHKETKNSKRRPSDAEEVEAGIALAGMGLGLPPGQLRRENVSGPISKKAKKDEGKKGEKDNKKSCSECRRLKAKCDRVFPCSNCRRRGCALVCPDGDLSCMQGKRLVLASTEQLHERIAQLEAALSQSHSKISGSNHPLLAPQYLDGGFAAHPPPPLDETLQTIKQSSSPPNRQPTLPDQDQLSPRDRSSASSHLILTPKLSSERSSSQGRMAVESLLLNGSTAAAEGKREDEWVGENAPPAMIVGNMGGEQSPTPDASENQLIVDRLRDILRVLPPREETHRRGEHFWTTGGWYNSMLHQSEFENVYEPAVYAPTPQNPLSPHKLACVLMVLTMDTYFDLSAEEESPAVAEYWEGAQRCFDTRFGWAASVAGVQALSLATLFVGFGWRGARASNFYWLRQMTSAAQQIGLHKDPHPSLPEDERDFRRRVFWDCYMIDCLISINHGQRTAFSLDNVDTLMPSKCPKLHRMKYEYMRSIKSRIIDIGCRTDSSPASWEQISATAQMLHQYDVKNAPDLHCPILCDKITPPRQVDPTILHPSNLLRSTTSLCHYKAMMFLYRPSLRRLIARLRSQPREAIVFNDEDRQTVSMTYNACHAITAISLYMSRTHPRLSARFWAVWVQTFSSAVSMAALAIWCGPHLEANFIQSAYNELTETCDMIRENGSKRSRGVLSLLPILQSLVHNRYPQVIGQSPAAAQISIEGEDMLFALLGGQVDQKGVEPRQGLLMNPPVVVAYPNTVPSTNVRQLGAIYPPQAQIANDGSIIQVDHTTTSYHPQQDAHYSAVWHDSMQMALPVVAPHPSASPIDGYPMQFPLGGQRMSDPQQSLQQQAHPQHSLPGHSQQQHHQQQTTMFDNMTNDDLWARLQTFYEPTPATWGQSVGSEGFVDYGKWAMPGGMA